jgi:hypothetical protein
MNKPIDHSEFTEQEQRLLEEVERLVTDGSPETRVEDSLFGFCAHLVGTIPSVDSDFKQSLEDRLMERWNERELGYNKITTVKEHRETHITSLKQRVMAGIDHLQKNIIKPAGMTMKRRLVFFMVAVMVVAILTAAFVPPVRAVVVEAIKSVVISPYASVQQVPEPDAKVIKPEPPKNLWLIKTDIGNFGGNIPSGLDATVHSVRSFEEAQSSSGFRLLAPTYLLPGYSLREVKVAPLNEGTFLFYSGPGREIIIVQMPAGYLSSDDPNVETVGATGMITTGSLEEVDFDGQKAAWVDGHTLDWGSKEFTYEVGGLDLDLQQAMEIARSLR